MTTKETIAKIRADKNCLTDRCTETVLNALEDGISLDREDVLFWE